MNIFQLRDKIIEDYQAFSRSFTRIEAPDIRDFLNEKYEAEHFWKPPLIQINPRFEQGPTIEQLVYDGRLHPGCKTVFRVGEGSENESVRLYRHQEQAVDIALSGSNYVVTTGTGSGKSFSYFVPLVHHILQEKEKQQAEGAAEEVNAVKAILVYPMNALVNSQLEALQALLDPEKFDNKPPITFAQYTGQDSEEDKQAAAENPPDILLTNFMMLELMMTRRNAKDAALINAAKNLSFLVLDELHSYRGRQGADVAMLVRRVRLTLNPNLICVGTSATMSKNEDGQDDQAAVVAKIAGEIFGTTVKRKHIVTEFLEPRTILSDIRKPSFANALKAAIRTNVWEKETAETLPHNPMAIWVERNLGLKSSGSGKWERADPRPLNEVVKELQAFTNLSESLCSEALNNFLAYAHQIRDSLGQPFFAFKLHQFISGADRLYATLERVGARAFDLQGQQYVPGDRERIFYSVHFCRNCGQEYYPVFENRTSKHAVVYVPRAIEDLDKQEDGEPRHGYFMPLPSGFVWDDLYPRVPANWLQDKRGVPVLKPARKNTVPKEILLGSTGRPSSDGLAGLWIRGRYAYCPVCMEVPQSRSEKNKLASLGNEGRSSATSILTYACLNHSMDAGFEDDKCKLLGFTDNRQDASLQSGHFNDFVFMLTLRGALLGVLETHPGGLGEIDLVAALYEKLGFEAPEFRDLWLQNPDLAAGRALERASRYLKGMLAYRFYQDQRRGWRFNNPNLEQLGLLTVEYEGLKEHVRDAPCWQACDPRLASAGPIVRERLLSLLLDHMRWACCITTSALEAGKLAELEQAGLTTLKEPWGVAADEPLQTSTVMFPCHPASRGRPKQPALWLGPRSRFGRLLRARQTWSENSRPLADTQWEKGQAAYALKEDEYASLLGSLIEVAAKGGLLRAASVYEKVQGYQIPVDVLVWKTTEVPTGTNASGYYIYNNPFYIKCYQAIAGRPEIARRLLRLGAAEHTAQVDNQTRFERERHFKEALLRVLYCSPTMELGVDIKTLNTVFMRNVPPTPANYAQRSGRAGRSGQPALIMTYCAALSAHDQYFYQNPKEMVSGTVRAPNLDLANEDLIAAHLNAMWLSSPPVDLPASVVQLLEVQNPSLPIKAEIQTHLMTPDRKRQAMETGRLLLESLETALVSVKDVWFDDSWLERQVVQAYDYFDRALGRWRGLFQAAKREVDNTSKMMGDTRVPIKDREAAKRLNDEAFKQMRAMEQEKAGQNMDFYTYRYLAGEGFLPGYNFPRLPLWAFIPGKQRANGRDAFLKRPRFLAISEFGPRSTIYHEGRRYRIYRALVGLTDTNAAKDALLTSEIRVCAQCGYGHIEQAAKDARCHACDTPLEPDAVHVNNLFKIRNVSCKPDERITCEEEERLRQGFDMQTAVRWSTRYHRFRKSERAFVIEGGFSISAQYGPSATVWRMNLGRRRRKEQAVLGFNIHVDDGTWATKEKTPAKKRAGKNPTDDAVPVEKRAVMRISPYVSDQRNILILRIDRCDEQTDNVALTTLQHALKRGIEKVFQLEESELAAEPLPRREQRRALLFYEAAEGGAGALTHLVHAGATLKRVALAALDICHFELDETTGEFHDTHGEHCGAACYRCLLSYYNQPDHEFIDRHHPVFRRLLRNLIQAKPMELVADQPDPTFTLATRSDRAEMWLNRVQSSGLCLPDLDWEGIAAASHYGPEANGADFVYTKDEALVYIENHPSPEQKEFLVNKGYAVVSFAGETDEWPAIFEEYEDIFFGGTG